MPSWKEGNTSMMGSQPHTMIIHIRISSKVTKMKTNISTRVENHLDNKSHSIFHHDLVKLLVLIELMKRNFPSKHCLV